MMNRRSTLGPEVIELTIKKRVTLQKRGYHLRSDHLAALKRLALDLALDDYDFSQAEMLRAALADFLALPIGEQVYRLERYREVESEMGLGKGRA
jgi:hypothetical protein